MTNRPPVTCLTIIKSDHNDLIPMFDDLPGIDTVQAYCMEQNRVNAVFEDFARRRGISSTALHVSTIIASVPDCTQKTISEHLALPKQTVHAAVTKLWREGFVTLREDPGDRRNKIIEFTDRGREVAEEVVGVIRRAESEAIMSMTEEQRRALVECTAIFARNLREAMGSEL